MATFLSTMIDRAKADKKTIVLPEGNDERILLTSVFDNLGKGASGAAVECMNLVTGAEKTLGLEL